MNQVEPGKLQPALIGGVALGVASAIPILSCLNCACCALVIGGGFLAAYLYLKECPPAAEARYGDAAMVGLLAGVFGAVVGTLMSIPVRLLFSGMGDMGQMEELLDNFDLPPEAQDALLNLFGGELAVGTLFISFFVSLVLYSIFAIIGALIGAAVMHKRQAPAQAPFPPPPVQ